MVTKQEDILEAWAEYFQKLGAPLESDHFNAEYKHQVEEDVTMLESHCAAKPAKFHPITSDEVLKAVSKLNKGKASDPTSISAEHIIYSAPITTSPLVELFNAILSARYIPETFRIGDLLPIPKKAKDSKIQTNHRGITISSIIGKIFDQVLIARDKDTLEKDQSLLQFGFTNGRNPTISTVLMHLLTNHSCV